MISLKASSYAPTSGTQPDEELRGDAARPMRCSALSMKHAFQFVRHRIRDGLMFTVRISCTRADHALALLLLPDKTGRRQLRHASSI